MDIPNKDCLRQHLLWVRCRMEALDEIDARLREMRELAEYARDNYIGSAEAQEVNDKLRAMQEEIAEIDEKTRVFWKGYQ